MVSKSEFPALVAKAEAAGMAALEARKPTPMVVGEPTTPFGSTINYAKPFYYCGEGACGFAWIEFAGNTSFGKWMKKAGKARSQHPSGLCVWVSEGGQSVERKESYAAAYAKVLNDAGITACPNSRLD